MEVHKISFSLLRNHVVKFWKETVSFGVTGEENRLLVESHAFDLPLNPWPPALWVLYHLYRSPCTIALMVSYWCGCVYIGGTLKLSLKGTFCIWMRNGSRHLINGCIWCPGNEKTPATCLHMRGREVERICDLLHRRQIFYLFFNSPAVI